MTTGLYPLAKNGIFSTIQGEGLLCGIPMVFVRLAGCSVRCPLCDTDYTVSRRATVDQITDEINAAITTGVEWVWITGGEPTDYNLDHLCRALRRTGLRLALATSGTRPVRRGVACDEFDFVSVSPHNPRTWVLKQGDQLNIVPGLNGFSLTDFAGAALVCQREFNALYVTPCDGRPETLQECLEWVMQYPRWRLGVQAHKIWGLP